MKINDCKGCYSDKEACYFTDAKKDKPDEFRKLPICPCVGCIVKMVCNLPCQEYSDFSNIFSWRNQKRNTSYGYIPIKEPT